MMNPFKNKKGLGRGLSSLIGDNEIRIPKSKISNKDIIKNKFQQRKHFEKEAMEEITKSSKEREIMRPNNERKSETENEQ